MNVLQHMFCAKKIAKLILFFVAFISLNATSFSQARWITGDFHQHTTYTDGSFSFMYMMDKNNYFGLDWWANSEHGGGFTTNGLLSGKDLNKTYYWDTTSYNPILGLSTLSSGHQYMWRWQSIKDFSFPSLVFARNIFPNKTIVQGYEWNAPGHEHSSFAILEGQFGDCANVNPIAEFEYKFDASDADTVGGKAFGWVKSVNSNHAKTVEAATWCETNYPTTSWIILAHPERKFKWDIQSIRDMNNAAPDVCFGFESMPGHQRSSERGEYKLSYNTEGICTYGGTGIYSAKIGGLWDALLTEGRHYWLFANCDFHDTTNDFHPGEYQKNHIYSADGVKAQAIINGMRSGNVWVAQGDLIDTLVFTASHSASSTNYSVMGETATVNDSNVYIKIRVHTPLTPNHNIWSSYNLPEVNHIDIIGGKLLPSKIASTDANYKVASVSTTKVIARFDKNGGVSDSNGITSTKWNDIGNGWKEMTFEYAMPSNMYFRLRGTNLALNVANETDGNGNPLPDTLMQPNNAEKAFSDLWFYSNPIFVKSSSFTAVKDNEKDDARFQFYPNPTKDQLTVQSPLGTALTITNIEGKKVFQNTIHENLLTIDTQDLISGVYFLTFEYSGDTIVKKLVKE